MLKSIFWKVLRSVFNYQVASSPALCGSLFGMWPKEGEMEADEEARKTFRRRFELKILPNKKETLVKRAV